jgi:hypothetical protein
MKLILLRFNILIFILSIVLMWTGHIPSGLLLTLLSISLSYIKVEDM